jgi:hypothetical protein
MGDVPNRGDTPDSELLLQHVPSMRGDTPPGPYPFGNGHYKPQLQQQQQQQEDHHHHQQQQQEEEEEEEEEEVEGVQEEQQQQNLEEDGPAENSPTKPSGDPSKRRRRNMRMLRAVSALDARAFDAMWNALGVHSQYLQTHASRSWYLGPSFSRSLIQ